MNLRGDERFAGTRLAADKNRPPCRREVLKPFRDHLHRGRPGDERSGIDCRFNENVKGFRPLIEIPGIGGYPVEIADHSGQYLFPEGGAFQLFLIAELAGPPLYDPPCLKMITLQRSPSGAPPPS